MRALREETDLERRKRQEEIELLKQELQRLRLEKEKAKDPYVPQGRAVPERPDAVRQQSSKIRIFAKDVQVDKGRKLGEGGFGIVYAGTIYETTRVAIKVIKAHDDFKVRRAFERELSTWEGLIHPNVLPLMAYCAEPPMMISEIVSDGNIRVFLEKHSWKAELGLDLLRQVATGMSFLHAKNVLHGDLTPRNILVENGVARIMDFGLSKVRGEVSKSTAGSVLGPSGTSGYMSPELYDDQPLRKPADVFAFSIISCEVVGQGDPPWGHSPRPLLVGQWIKNGRRPERPYEASDEVWSLITRCWHPEPWERPTFVEIVKEMNQIIVK
ncbi:kinase-like domain-containing protein [Hyaloraphidium curvatum]|nr:kinase-like domain-containing protein [Hyaloraphidium curvatum]